MANRDYKYTLGFELGEFNPRQTRKSPRKEGDPDSLGGLQETTSEGLEPRKPKQAGHEIAPPEILIIKNDEDEK